MSEKSKIEIVHVWAQTIAIVLAGIWAIYTFLHKEVYKPSRIQGNLSTEIELSDGGIKKGLQMIVANIELTNDSDRTLYTLDGYFVVYGLKNRLQENYSFVSDLNNSFHENDESFLSKYSQVESEIIAGGNIFEFYDFTIGGKSSKDLIFEFPDGCYDYIELRVVIPVINKEYDLYVETTLDSLTNEIHTLPFLCDNSTKVYLDEANNKRHKKLIESLDYAEISFDAIISNFGSTNIEHAQSDGRYCDIR